MRIAFLGDVGLFGQNVVINKEKFESRTENIRFYLNRFDYVVANLETPLTNHNEPIGGKSAYIKGSPLDAQLLKMLGITHVTLSNNHICDYKWQGLKDTIKALNQAGIEWYGIHGKTCELLDGDTKIRLHGYCCYSTNGKCLGDFVDVLNPLQMLNDIENDMDQGFFPVLSCHWGEEHVHYPNYDHMVIAHHLADAGSCFIHGHHPHVVQGIEEYKGSVIAYSLGNFVFDDVYTDKSRKPLVKLSHDNRETVVLDLTFNNNKIEGWSVSTYYFDSIGYKQVRGLARKIHSWTRDLLLPKNFYIKLRNDQLRSYLYERKKKRNLKWYISRVNIESLRMLVSFKCNKDRYNKLIKNFNKRA